jgi:hypothetical protein
MNKNKVSMIVDRQDRKKNRPHRPVANGLVEKIYQSQMLDLDYRQETRDKRQGNKTRLEGDGLGYLFS